MDELGDLRQDTFQYFKELREILATRLEELQAIESPDGLPGTRTILTPFPRKCFTSY